MCIFNVFCNINIIHPLSYKVRAIYFKSTINDTCNHLGILKFNYRFHDGDIREEPAAKSSKLILHNLRQEDSGLYSCRVCSDAGCIMSEPGNLTVLIGM